MHIWSFIGGIFVGSVVGVVVMALCVASGKEDRRK